MTTTSYETFYKAVYGQDTDAPPSHGWIQWKGTDVCMDMHCKCGHHGHVDAGFFYYYECPSCHQRYAVGMIVKLIPLTDEQGEYVESDRSPFETGSRTGFSLSPARGPSLPDPRPPHVQHRGEHEPAEDAEREPGRHLVREQEPPE